MLKAHQDDKELMAVSELMAQTGQSKEDVLSFLKKSAIPVFTIGSKQFFLRNLLLQLFTPPGASAQQHSDIASLTPLDELERQKIIAWLQKHGLELVCREGIREMVMFFRIKEGWMVSLDLLNPHPGAITLSNEVNHRIKVYVAKKTVRGVAHFSASDFLDDQPGDLESNPGHMYVFRSAELQFNFLYTQNELIRAWNALRVGKPHAWRGMRLYGKGSLQLALSRSMQSMSLERRIVGQQMEASK